MPKTAALRVRNSATSLSGPHSRSLSLRPRYFSTLNFICFSVPACPATSLAETTIV